MWVSRNDKRNAPDSLSLPSRNYLCFLRRQPSVPVISAALLRTLVPKRHTWIVSECIRTVSGSQGDFRGDFLIGF